MTTWRVDISNTPAVVATNKLWTTLGACPEHPGTCSYAHCWPDELTFPTSWQLVTHEQQTMMGSCFQHPGSSTYEKCWPDGLIFPASWQQYPKTSYELCWGVDFSNTLAVVVMNDTNLKSWHFQRPGSSSHKQAMNYARFMFPTPWQ